MVNHFTAAAFIFIATYLVLALGRLPGFRVDRPGIAIIGATAMVVTGVIGFDDAYRAIDYRTIVLLFGMMIVVANLRLSGFFRLAGLWALKRAHHPRSLLVVIVVLSGVLSALFVNDIVCLVLTPVVLAVVRALKRNPLPYLIAVATASNVGSVATITGNPQNMIIGSLSGISYAAFARQLVPVAIAGLIVDALLLLWIFRAEFTRAQVDVGPLDERLRIHRGLVIKSCLVAVVMLGLFFAGVPLALASIAAAAYLLLTRRVKPQKVYGQIDWGLLVLFSGLFVVVSGIEISGVSHWIFEQLPTLGSGHLAMLGVSSVVLSNLVSNVPAVLLFKPVISSFADPLRAWLTLAAASTLAGNLTLLGSVANLIVAETARKEGIIVGFRDYVRVGIPLTAVTVALALSWLIFVAP